MLSPMTTVVRDRGAPGRPAARGDRVRRATELLGVVALLALLAVAAFGAQLRPGGFYNDDWAYLTNAVFPVDDSFAGAVRELSWIWFRPLMMVYWPFTFRVLGT